MTGHMKGTTMEHETDAQPQFHLLVDPVLGWERAERLATLIAEMDTVENVQSLTEMLR